MFQILQRVCSRAIKENLYEEILVYNVTRIMKKWFWGSKLPPDMCSLIYGPY